MIIPFAELQDTLRVILSKNGFDDRSSIRIAQIFASSSLDGYHSHGVNRFREFVRNVHKGIIDPSKSPKMISTHGSIERWDGQRGAGPMNAYTCMQRAIEMAKGQVMGCVALSNTNHWMRGGSYGWQAAEAGCMAICFTNTMPNMPPWGGKTPTTGNNPLIIAVPRDRGHLVLDMSLSQFSYGKLWLHRLQGSPLPFQGGYDADGVLTSDPAAIIESKRILQTGYWKGSGLSIMIDLLAAILSGGLATADIADLPAETALSQVFICVDPSQLNESTWYQELVDHVVAHYGSAELVDDHQPIAYPGERTVHRRKRGWKDGIMVDDHIWSEILAL